MINEKVRTLIDKLLEKTIANQVNWNRSSGNFGFQLILTNGSVSIDSFFDDNSDQQIITFNLYNDRGESIESLGFGKKEHREYYDYLENFYNMVKRKYLHVDETIDSFFKEIDRIGTIGKIVNNDDVDLPF